MRRRIREFLVVVFVLLGIGLAVFAYFWFSGRLETGLRKSVAVVFDDVTGLRVGDPVEVQGLPKGKVVSLRLEKGRVRCRVLLDRDVELTRDTRFAIRSVSYLGSDRYLMVTLGSGPAADAGLVFDGVNEALDLEETFLRLDRMLGRIDPSALTGELRKVGEELMATIQRQLDRFHGQIGRLNQNLDVAAQELQGLSEGLDSLAGLLAPESTAGKLLNSDELYEEVRKTNQELQELIADIKKNPKRYFKISIF